MIQVANPGSTYKAMCPPPLRGRDIAAIGGMLMCYNFSPYFLSLLAWL